MKSQGRVGQRGHHWREYKNIGRQHCEHFKTIFKLSGISNMVSENIQRITKHLLGAFVKKKQSDRDSECFMKQVKLQTKDVLDREF